MVYWWEKRKLVPFDKSIKNFALDYEKYLKKQIPIKRLTSYFPKQDLKEIEYFLKTYDKAAHYDFLKSDDFEGRWKIFEKARKEVGKI